ncbi:MAG: bifunctional hydroxymethylpyrimidine kinase/phosphomethylpyrimidine kinase, partial [Pseudomonadota bacterium]
VQNTMGVTAVHPIPADVVAGQISAVLDDIGADAIKIGMLANADICRSVAAALSDVLVPVVLDPVMVATSGDRLLEDDAISLITDQLAPRAQVITPNLPEFDLLCGLDMPTDDARVAAAKDYVKRTGAAVALKGGHGTDVRLRNVLITPGGLHMSEYSRIKSRHTHGTGCTFSSAIAALLARGEALPEAMQQAGDFVHQAIVNAPGFGQGHGPLDFLNTLKN